jgi:SAM-dependent methyltransferase
MDDYGKVAKYWDLIQSRFCDYDADATRIRRMLGDGGVKTVADIACGTGSHLIPLARMGYECTGFDISAEMIALAQAKAEERGLAIRFLQGDMTQAGGEDKFDAVLCLYAMPGMKQAEFEQIIKNVRQMLRPEGLFIFNVINSEYESPMPLEGSDGPINYIDLAIDQGPVKLVRLNTMSVSAELQDWTAVYLIQDHENLSIEVLHNPMRFSNLEGTKQLLKEQGFEFCGVEYADVEDFKNWDMFVCSRLVN